MKRSNKYNKVCVFCVCVIYFLFVLFWVGAISAGEEDCFPVLQCVITFVISFLSSLWTTTSKPTCVCVCVSKCHFIWNCVFFCFIKMFHLRWRKYYTHICWFEEICDFVFGSYRVINVHKGVRTMLLIFLSLSLSFFTLLLSVGFYFGVTSYFSLFL